MYVRSMIVTNAYVRTGTHAHILVLRSQTTFFCLALIDWRFYASPQKGSAIFYKPGLSDTFANVTYCTHDIFSILMLPPSRDLRTSQGCKRFQILSKGIPLYSELFLQGFNFL